MAGLVAAARARELGAGVRLLEKGDRPGGSMLLSSGVVWRYRDFDEFRRQCPNGHAALQRLIWERLDEALDWLEGLGAAGTPHTTNPLHDRTQIRPRQSDRGARAGCGRGGARTVVTRGRRAARGRDRRLFGAARRDSAGCSSAPTRGPRARASTSALARGAAEAPSDEFYGRAMPGPVPEEQFVAASQLYGRFARRVNDLGEEFFPGEVSWSENDLAQAIAAQPGGRAWYELDAEALARPEVAEKLPYAQETEPLQGGGLRVRVYAAVTHTYGGVRVDTRARAADGVWVAGVDAGGVSNGGYASGLAQALVLGLAAAEDARQ